MLLHDTQGLAISIYISVKCMDMLRLIELLDDTPLAFDSTFERCKGKQLFMHRLKCP